MRDRVFLSQLSSYYHRIKVRVPGSLVHEQYVDPGKTDCSPQGQLIGFPEDELPVLVQLEGGQDTAEFWMQEDARTQLQSQMLAAISETLPTNVVEQPLPQRSAPPPAGKSSFFGRKQGKAQDFKEAPEPVKPSVAVEVQLEEVHFRTETEYGLYETIRGRGVLVTIDVR